MLDSFLACKSSWVLVWVVSYVISLCDRFILYRRYMDGSDVWDWIDFWGTDVRLYILFRDCKRNVKSLSCRCFSMEFYSLCLRALFTGIECIYVTLLHSLGHIIACYLWLKLFYAIQLSFVRQFLESLMSLTELYTLISWICAHF